jgi:drug/metabolite transporter (DMT)-like permease
MKRSQILPILQALLAAVLFGASAPFSKLLLAEIQPVTLAGLLYLGCGFGAVLLRVFRSRARRSSGQIDQAEASLNRSDLLWVGGAILCGGILGPILLLVGLRQTPATTASLLLNFESVATALIAALIFREATGRGVWWAMALITLASAVLSWDSSGRWGVSLGAVAVLSACLMWGIDNNLTRSVSAKDPLMIVMVKGLAAGSFSLGLSLVLGYPLPDPRLILLAMLLGSLSYGASIGLFVLALRGLGAARSGALYATAPFAGALLAFLILRESLTTQILVSIPLMILGAGMLIFEDHGHAHEHTLVEHEHRHQHDDLHHIHNHADRQLDFLKVDKHSHLHRHDDVTHDHAHTPDIHHWHEHK